MQPDISNIPLRDIHLPGDISWWPPAIGWWIVAALIILLGLGLYMLKRRRERRKVAKAALKELVGIKTVYDKNLDAKSFITKLSILLRRVCITIFPNENVASIIGKDWLEFLDQCIRDKGKTNEPLFTRKAAADLLNVPYMKNIQHRDMDIEQLYKISEVWIKNLPDFQVDKFNKTKLA